MGNPLRRGVCALVTDLPGDLGDLGGGLPDIGGDSSESIIPPVGEGFGIPSF